MTDRQNNILRLALTNKDEAGFCRAGDVFEVFKKVAIDYAFYLPENDILCNSSFEEFISQYKLQPYHNDNPVKVIKTERSGNQKRRGGDYIGINKIQQVDGKTPVITMLQAAHLFHKQKEVAVAFYKWHLINSKLYGMKTTEELFDIFIKQYQP